MAHESYFIINNTSNYTTGQLRTYTKVFVTKSSNAKKIMLKTINKQNIFYISGGV